MLANMVYMLNTIGGPEELCKNLEPVLRIVGIVILGIKIVVPIILIIVGMLDMAKAVTEKKEENIKAAQQGLIKKAIAAVIVFLVASIVVLLMGLVGSKEYENCMKCIKDPFNCNISLVTDTTNNN